MNVFLFIGGAYGDSRYVHTSEPDQDEWRNWSHGELEIFKIDSEMRIWEPERLGIWRQQPVKTIV